MHADTQQLIALSDGEPIDHSVHTHVLRCERCQGEVEALQRVRSRLAALPTVAPPPPSARVLSAAPAPSRRGRPLFLSLAASLVLAAALAVWLAPREASPPAATTATVQTGRSDDAGADRALQLRSAQLERQWRALRRYSGAVGRVGAETGTARIKSRLLALDAEHLFAADEGTTRGAGEYWDQRVRLLGSLVEIERAELLAGGEGNYRVVRSELPAERL